MLDVFREQTRAQRKLREGVIKGNDPPNALPQQATLHQAILNVHGMSPMDIIDKAGWPCEGLLRDGEGKLYWKVSAVATHFTINLRD